MLSLSSLLSQDPWRWFLAPPAACKTRDGPDALLLQTLFAELVLFCRIAVVWKSLQQGPAGLTSPFPALETAKSWWWQLHPSVMHGDWMRVFWEPRVCVYTQGCLCITYILSWVCFSQVRENLQFQDPSGRGNRRVWSRAGWVAGLPQSGNGGNPRRDRESGG